MWYLEMVRLSSGLHLVQFFRNVTLFVVSYALITHPPGLSRLPVVRLSGSSFLTLVALYHSSNAVRRFRQT